MVISRTPLRISLAGGSTDLLEFVEQYGKGSVISFPCTVYTYIFLALSSNYKYRISYSRIEEVDNVNDIKNDVAREVIKYFDLPPVKIIFDSDISSTGSGLASSSSYVISFVGAVNNLLNLNLSQFEICKIALEIEHKFNPLTGYQDPYGCGLGGLKRLDFYTNKVQMTFLDSNGLSQFKMYLFNTEITRKSSDILSTLDLKKGKFLLKLVDELEQKIHNKNKICRILNLNWKQKKKTSKLVTNDEINTFEDIFLSSNDIKGFKLCGAGAGGYFFILSDKAIENDDFKEIKIDTSGVVAWTL